MSQLDELLIRIPAITDDADRADTAAGNLPDDLRVRRGVDRHRYRLTDKRDVLAWRDRDCEHVADFGVLVLERRFIRRLVLDLHRIVELVDLFDLQIVAGARADEARHRLRFTLFDLIDVEE